MSELNGELHYRRAPRRPWRVAALSAVPALLVLVSAAGCSSSSSASAPAGAPASSSSASSAGASPVASSSSASAGTSSSSPGSGVGYAQSQVALYQKAVSTYQAPGPALNAQKVAALKGKTVLFVPDGLVGPFVLAQQAMQSALGHVGVSVKTCDPNFLPPQVAACFGQARTDGAVAVVTSGIPYSLAANAYRGLEARHIPVLVSSAGLGSPANAQGIAFQTEVPATSLAGRLSADEVIADSHGTANVLYVSATGASGVEAQAAATKAEFAKYCPGCKVDSLSFDATATTQITSGVSSQLLSNPATSYILSQSDALLPYIVPGVQTAGFANKVKVVSGAGAAAVLLMIQQHQRVIADSSFDASYIGWNAADGVLRLLTGAAVPTDPFIPIRVFTATNLVGVKLSPAMDVNPLYGSAGYQQMFYDVWTGKTR